MSYDTKCYYLARDFLSDYEAVPETDIMELAQAIQDTIDAYLEERREVQEARREWLRAREAEMKGAV